MGNKTQFYGTVSLLLALSLSVCQSVSAAGVLTPMQASGEAPSVDEAVKAAYGRAIRAATRQFPLESSGEKFRLLLTETIAASAGDFISSHEILNKRHEQDEYAARHPELKLDRPGLWQVQLEAKVDVSALRKRWAELSELLAKRAPVVLVLGQDVVEGQPAGESVSADVISKVLGKFSVETLTNKDISEGSDLSGAVTYQQALAIAGELNADLFIIAQAKALPAGEGSSSGFETSVELCRNDKDKPIEAYANTIINRTAEMAAEPASHQLKIQARILLPKLLDGFFRAWPEAVANSIEKMEQAEQKISGDKDEVK